MHGPECPDKEIVPLSIYLIGQEFLPLDAPATLKFMSALYFNGTSFSWILGPIGIILDKGCRTVVAFTISKV
jgi:hypothetical protein